MQRLKQQHSANLILLLPLLSWTLELIERGFWFIHWIYLVCLPREIMLDMEHIFLPSHLGLHLKERICSIRSKFFSLRVAPILLKVSSIMQATCCRKKVVCLCKMVANSFRCICYLNLILLMSKTIHLFIYLLTFHSGPGWQTRSVAFSVLDYPHLILDTL